jgi:hypothetical protein
LPFGDYQVKRGTPWAADIAAPYAKMVARLRNVRAGEAEW